MSKDSTWESVGKSIAGSGWWDAVDGSVEYSVRCSAWKSVVASIVAPVWYSVCLSVWNETREVIDE